MRQHDIYAIFNGERQLAFTRSLTATRIYVEMFMKELVKKYVSECSNLNVVKMVQTRVEEPASNFCSQETIYNLYGTYSYLFFSRERLLETVSYQKLSIINDENVENDDDRCDDNDCPCNCELECVSSNDGDSEATSETGQETNEENTEMESVEEENESVALSQDLMGSMDDDDDPVEEKKTENTAVKRTHVIFSETEESEEEKPDLNDFSNPLERLHQTTLPVFSNSPRDEPEMKRPRISRWDRDQPLNYYM